MVSSPVVVRLHEYLLLRILDTLDIEHNPKGLSDAIYSIVDVGPAF